MSPMLGFRLQRRSETVSCPSRSGVRLKTRMSGIRGVELIDTQALRNAHHAAHRAPGATGIPIPIHRPRPAVAARSPSLLPHDQVLRPDRRGQRQVLVGSVDPRRPHAGLRATPHVRRRGELAPLPRRRAPHRSLARDERARADAHPLGGGHRRHAACADPARTGDRPARRGHPAHARRRSQARNVVGRGCPGSDCPVRVGGSS